MSSGVQHVVGAHTIIGVALVIYAMVVAVRRSRLGRERELLRRLEERPEAIREGGGERAAPRAGSPQAVEA